MPQGTDSPWQGLKGVLLSSLALGSDQTFPPSRQWLQGEHESPSGELRQTSHLLPRGWEPWCPSVHPHPGPGTAWRLPEAGGCRVAAVSTASTLPASMVCCHQTGRLWKACSSFHSSQQLCWKTGPATVWFLGMFEKHFLKIFPDPKVASSSTFQ